MSIELDQAPSITLGGKQWVIPMLAAKQNKVIDPLILGLLPTFATWQTDKAAALSGIDTQKYNDLLTIAYVAITRASPETKRADFEDLHITLPELIAAFTVIAQQTGVFLRGTTDTPGEAKGEDNSPTGTK